MSEKPEWFQITEGDEKPEAKQRKRGFLKIAAVALPLVVVGAVAVGANGEEDDAPQFSPTINSAAQNSTSTIAKSSNTATNSPKVSTISNPSATAPANPSGPSNPGNGVQPPKGGGNDDHEGFDGREPKKFNGENHEGREHHREGTFSTKN
jgi:hypothetical protein